MDRDSVLFGLVGLLHPEASPGFGSAHVVILDAYRSGRALDDVLDRSSGLFEGAGLLAVLAPRATRTRIVARLRERGLTVTALAVRGSHSWEQLASLDRRALSFALGLSGARRWRRRLLEWLPERALPSNRLAVVLPKIAILAYSSPAAVASWLYHLAPDDEEVGPVVAALSADQERAYIFRFPRAHEVPSAVAKVGLSSRGDERVAREGVALRKLAAGARDAGAEVPEVLDMTTAGARSVLLESFVRGDVVAAALAARPDRLDELVARVSQWLALWNRSTRVAEDGAAELLEFALRGHVEVLSAALPSTFLRRVRSGADRLPAPVLTTAAHHDLTMWNVLIGVDGQLAVLDWEQAGERALPLTDLFYTLVDAVAATTAYQDRRSAFRSCFGVDGSRSSWARSIVGQHIKNLDLSADLVAVSFLACWLRHGASDLRRGANQGFTDVVRDLADQPKRFWPVDQSALISSVV